MLCFQEVTVCLNLTDALTVSSVLIITIFSNDLLHFLKICTCINIVKNPCDCGCYANRGIGNDNKGGKGQAGAKGDSEDKTKQKKQGDKGGGDNDDKGGKKKKKSFTSAAAVSTRPPKSTAKGKDGSTKDSINKQAKGKDSKKLDGQDPEEGKGDGKSRKDKDKENEKGGERPSKSNVKGKDGHGEHGDKSKGLSESQTGSCIGGQFLKGRKKSKMRRSKAAKGNLPNRFEETGISHLLRIKLENRDLCRW